MNLATGELVVGELVRAGEKLKLTSGHEGLPEARLPTKAAIAAKARGPPDAGTVGHAPIVGSSEIDLALKAHAAAMTASSMGSFHGFLLRERKRYHADAAACHRV